EEVSAVVSLEFLRMWSHVGIVREEGCLQRSLCRANARSADWGEHAEAIAHAYSIAFVSWAENASLISNETSLLTAAQTGREESLDDCYHTYDCPQDLWAVLLDDHKAMATLESYINPSAAAE
ncbi:unnamed protein product, partial [Meganyctiphanes norvegica]